MGKKLEKTNVLYARDEDGALIPQERELVIDEEDKKQAEYKGQTIGIIPLTRGEIRRMFGEVTKEVDITSDKDGEILVKNCIRPTFTTEEVAFTKPSLTSAIVNTILSESGLDVKGITRKASAKKAETEFSKNSIEPEQIE